MEGVLWGGSGHDGRIGGGWGHRVWLGLNIMATDKTYSAHTQGSVLKCGDWWLEGDIVHGY